MRHAERAGLLFCSVVGQPPTGEGATPAAIQTPRSAADHLPASPKPTPGGPDGWGWATPPPLPPPACHAARLGLRREADPAAGLKDLCRRRAAGGAPVQQRRRRGGGGRCGAVVCAARAPGRRGRPASERQQAQNLHLCLHHVCARVHGQHHSRGGGRQGAHEERGGGVEGTARCAPPPSAAPPAHVLRRLCACRGRQRHLLTAVLVSLRRRRQERLPGALPRLAAAKPGQRAAPAAQGRCQLGGCSTHRCTAAAWRAVGAAHRDPARLLAPRYSLFATLERSSNTFFGAREVSCWGDAPPGCSSIRPATGAARCRSAAACVASAWSSDGSRLPPATFVSHCQPTLLHRHLAGPAVGCPSLSASRHHLPAARRSVVRLLPARRAAQAASAPAAGQDGGQGV